jgi:predicted AlkP superfamily phosphohydrolase/phosphomutase
MFLSFQDVDWKETRAYSLGNAGQLWINLRGREPEGIVEPGADYAAVRSDLVAKVREMCDPDTGEKMVDQVYVREELYQGPYVEQMPDVVFVPKGFRYLSFGEYEFASHRLVDVSLGITGWHRLQGMVLLHGAPIQAGGQVADARIEDLAPTILYLMGQSVPADMDGQVLSGALKPAWFDPKRLERIDLDPDMTREHRDLSDEDEEQVRQRLQGLGYLG